MICEGTSTKYRYFTGGYNYTHRKKEQWADQKVEQALSQNPLVNSITSKIELENFRERNLCLGQADFV
jgi:hypothetical protein